MPYGKPGDSRVVYPHGGAVTAPEKLRYMVRAFIEKPSPVPGGCPMLNMAVDADDTNPELRNSAREGFRNWKGRIAKIVEDGILSGEITKHTDPARIANQIVAHLEGALVISRLERTKEALLHAQESLSALIDSISLYRSSG